MEHRHGIITHRLKRLLCYIQQRGIQTRKENDST
nr:MAG TPA: hypothetical protein [Caudoviricetes sp.]